MFTHFDRIHECDTNEQTDRWTPHDGIGHACIASRACHLKMRGDRLTQGRRSMVIDRLAGV